MLKTRTAYQIFKAEDSSRTSASFASLAKELSLPYKIRAAEEKFVAALGVVEGDLNARRLYGASTLHAAAAYLSELASFISLASRAHHLETVSPNFAALERVAALYDVSPAARAALAKLSLDRAEAARVPTPTLDAVWSAVAARERALRQELRDAGESGAMFRRPARHVSDGASVSSGGGEEKDEGERDETEGMKINGETEENEESKRNEESEEVGRVEGTGQRELTPSSTTGKKRQSRTASAPAAVSDGKAPETTEELQGAPMRKVMRTQRSLTCGRLRALSNQEKKVVSMLTQFVQLLGHVYAVRFNNILPVFDMLEEKTRQAQDLIDAERKEFRASAEATAQEENRVATGGGDQTGEPRKIPVEPFLNVSLTGLLQAIHNASTTFRADEDCRYELDEDLLHPIAHACLTEINRIEGFTTVPFAPPSKEALEAKAKARQAARAKREEQRNRVLERARAKEEIAARREEDKRLVRARLGELDTTLLVEDSILKNPVPTAYVRYAALPLESPEQYDRALFIWVMFTSVPQVLHLSQMPFSLFLKGLLSDEQRENGLMDEVVQRMLDVVMKELPERAPSAPAIVTRGKTWFDIMAEYVAVVSGNKKKPPQKRRKPVVDDYDEEEESESDSDESDDDSDDTTDDTDEDEDDVTSRSTRSGSQKTASISAAAENGGPDNDKAKNEEAQFPQKEVEGLSKEEVKNETTENGEGVVKVEEAPDSLQVAVKKALANLAELRQHATWGNMDMDDRLTLLEYLVSETVNTNAVQEEAERLLKQEEDSRNGMDKRIRELRDEAEREVKSLVKKFLPSVRSAASSSAEVNKEGEHGKDSYEKRRQELLNGLAGRMRDVVAEHVGKQDGKDIGGIIRPIGMDRYRRIYWRFPFDQCLHVQTVAATQTDFPILREPREVFAAAVAESRPMLLDDEAEAVQGSAVAADDRGAPQCVWGTVPPEGLTHFIEGLDQRGVREAALRRSLEAMQPYLMSLTQPQSGRITRHRSSAFGYFNKLKIDL